MHNIYISGIINDKAYIEEIKDLVENSFFSSFCGKLKNVFGHSESDSVHSCVYAPAQAIVNKVKKWIWKGSLHLILHSVKVQH